VNAKAPLTLEAPHDLTTLPCSQSQKRFWFESQLHPENAGLNVAVRWRLEGDVSNAHLEQAWRLIIARHQTLRTYFATVDGEPRQVVLPAVPFHVPSIDLTGLADAAATAEAERIASLEARRTFDITQAPLLRVTHIRVRANLSMLLITAHHAVCDGWSIGVLAREMGEIYGAIAAGENPSPAPLERDYTDYVEWERRWQIASTEASGGREEVARRLAGFEPLEIVPDMPRPSIQTANGEIVSRLLDRNLTGALADLGRSNGCTLFMVAYAALLVLLQRYSGQSDIVIGTQIAGREEVEFERLVGTFINTVALRTDVAGDPTFVDLLERASDTVSDAFEFRHVPLEELVEIVNPQRDLSRNALFSVNFVYQRSFIQNQTYGPFRLVDMPSRSAGPICDVNFFMVERPEGWRLSCEFNTDLYRHETIARMLDRLVLLFSAVATDAARHISELPMMSDEERDRVVALGAGERTAYERDATVEAVFAARAAASPDAVAVADAKTTLTYSEVDRRANRLAALLRASGVKPGSAVGIALERSADIAVVLLGILRAGAVYVPLDPAWPNERIAFIVEDAAVERVLTQRSLRDRLPEDRIPIVEWEDIVSALIEGPADAPASARGADDVAYVMYTSGSSGRPKGVAVTHRGIVRLVRNTNYAALDPTDATLQHSPLAFDASTFEIWGPLLNGGRLAVAPPGLLSGADLERALSTLGVTTLWLTAAMFREMMESGHVAFERLRRLLVGGDVVSPQHAKRFLERYRPCTLINGYGPTENTTFSCCYPVASADEIGESVPIGRPIANSQAYVLDERMHPVPFGVVGELCVGGDGLALGYLHLPELTAERFVADPFAGPAARLYRTGDRVRQREDGVIEFLGRIDDQVKIRGYRVEPREIESALADHPEIADAVAVVGSNPGGDKTIWAYVVPREDTSVDAERLRAWLGERLPVFMLPSAIVTMPLLPLSANGKVDRRALPTPVRAAVAHDAAFRNETEATVAELLCELLATDHVARDVDIFSLGFHSLLAVRLAARVQQRFGVALGLRALFERPTVAAIAAQIGSTGNGTVAATAPPIVELNGQGALPPLWFFHGDLFAEGLYAHRLAAALGSDQPIRLVAPHGTAGLSLPPTIEGMALDYAERVREVQPNGPYRLGGFCASGLVAYELARILRARGETVERLVLVNSSPMPSKRIPFIDKLVQRFGLDARLAPRVRDRACYNLARAHAAAVATPLQALRATLKILSSFISRSHGTPKAQIPQPFEKRRGVRETEVSYSHVVAAFTYHPKPSKGEITLIWGEDQPALFRDPTMGWGSVTGPVSVLSMSGGHIAALDERIGELAGVMKTALRERT
jgi:aspartate racemase